MINSLTSGPIVLVILDGYGIAPESPSNPITSVDLPTFAKLRQESLHTRLWAHGEYVGLPKDQDGNSEAGHLNLGAGRIVKQDPVLISDTIRDGTFFKNPAFHEAMANTRRHHSALHLVGMLSNGQSAHATPEHLYALLELLDKAKVAKVWLHLFTDGRDSSPRGGADLLKQLEKELKPNQKIASICGRFYGMDRKKAWERTERAYNLIVLSEGACVNDAAAVFTESYRANITDEFIEPHVICEQGKPITVINDYDSVIFFNHRSDRARQLAKPFVQTDFVKSNPGAFTPKRVPKNMRFVAMTDFGPDLGDILTAWPSVALKDTLPVALSGKRQFYLAEAEKYAHITYFFNGGYANPVNGEERLMLPSPAVTRYDEAPGMMSGQLAEVIVKHLADNKYDFFGVNFACLDMVAHTGNFAAAQTALSAVDEALDKVMGAVMSQNGLLIVTADHGNIEDMKDLTSGEVDTEHSKNQVPFMLWPALNLPKLRHGGVLADVAPTILELFGIRQPEAMTGKSLFDRNSKRSGIWHLDFGICL